MGFITENILYFFQDIFADILSHLGYLIAQQYKTVIELNQTSEIANVTLFFTMLGAALCALMVGKQVISTYGFGTKGDPDQDAMEIVFRLCLALGAMGINSWLFTELTKFTFVVSSDLISSIGGASGSGVETAIRDIVDRGSSSSFMCFFSGFVVIGIIFFNITAYLRAAEITLSKMLLPIFALDLLNTNSEKWNMFIFQYVIGFGSYIVQMLCYQIFVYQLVRLDTADIGNLMLLVGWLVLSIKTPRWLEKYIYATGTGQAVSRGAGRLGQVIMYVGMRR